ncbi:unnamed protein product [Cyclocybe aegerita]|uniref:Uncharacterized protein n=1 Tax=Cyclocybe aegerita TaxID=1973307 RepID=A0A8S0W4T9_CYCAE|nr:unnamed protein product [Cyclocybe aegerita]
MACDVLLGVREHRFTQQAPEASIRVLIPVGGYCAGDVGKGEVDEPEYEEVEDREGVGNAVDVEAIDARESKAALPRLLLWCRHCIDIVDSSSSPPESPEQGLDTLAVG